MTQDLYAIAKQLDETAQGISYHGNALDVARGLPCVTANDVQCLNKWLHGTNTASDGFRLQEISSYVREYAIAQAAHTPTTFEFQNTLHTTPAAMCAHIAYSYITADDHNDPEDVSILLKRYASEELTDECLEGWNLCDQWLADRNITRADIVKAVRHFIKTRPDQVFSDEELLEAERDYQNDIDAKDQLERRAFAADGTLG